MGCSSSTPVVKDEAVVVKKKKVVEERSATTNTTNHTAAAAVTNHPNAGHNSKDSPATSNDASSITNTTTNDSDTREITTTNAVLGGNKLQVRYACLSRRGRDPDHLSKPNQDAYSIAEQFKSNGDDGGSFFGVYDGHGPTGELCSQFVQQTLPQLVEQHLQENAADLYHVALHEAHIECNQQLRASNINDAYSGTTCITMYVHGSNSGDDNDHKVTISNVGDSRAIMATPDNSSGTNSKALRAVPLSQDQTPKRQDEAARCCKAGARILSFGEIDPTTKDNDEEEDDAEDPPRVWSKKGNYPGVAFTRSFGDAVAETLGVYAEPEQLTLKLSPHEVKVIVLATDGIFDVVSNQDVIDTCQRYYPHNPTQACHAIVTQSHREWLLNDDCNYEDDDTAHHNFDDMTIICIFVLSNDHEQQEEEEEITTKAAAAASAAEVSLPTTSQQQEQQPQQKRVRHKQKTLRNLEEMGIME